MDVNLADLLGEVKAIAEFKSAFAQLLELAFTDPTTQLLNRRAFNEFAATTPTVEYAAAFIDLTAFKAINERHGHDAGDFALAHVGEHLARVCRPPAALPFRYGGDEFVVLISTSEVERFSLDNGARLRWEQLVLQRDGEPELAIPFAASIGIAHPDPEISVRDLVSRAEQAAMASKRNADGLVSWSPSHAEEPPSAEIRRRCANCDAISSVILGRNRLREDLLAVCPACGLPTREIT